MEIKDVKTFEEFVNAINKLGLYFPEEKAIHAQNEGLLPIFPKFFDIGGDVLTLVIDFVDELQNENNFMGSSTIELQENRGIYRVTIGPMAIELTKKHDSIIPISFVLKHELKHLLDHQVPYGDKKLWNVASDVVINEQIIKNMKLPEDLLEKIITLENLRKMEQSLCKECGISNCEKYFVSEDDLKSYMPTFKIYYKLYSLSQKCPKVIEIIDYYNNQFHKEKCNPTNMIDIEKEFFEKHRHHPVRTAGSDKFIEDLKKIDANETYIPWNELLKNILLGAVTNAEVIYPDWSKPNRRLVQYYQTMGVFIPSLKQTKPPNGFVIVDTSGSIFDDLYKKFIEAIKGLIKIVKPERVEVIFFSDTVIDKKVLEPDNIPEMPRPGEGGTMICDAMKYVYKNMKDEDFVVVLSDFEIYDEKSCRDVIENIGIKASAAIQVIPPTGNIGNKWKHWKQIIVNEW